MLIAYCRLHRGDQRAITITKLVIVKYLSVCCITRAQWDLDRPLRWHSSFDSFAEADCYNMFRFEKRHLLRAFRAWRFPDRVVTSNRLVFTGQEAMLRGLYEMVSGNDQVDIARDVFGRDQSAQSQV